jgi:hypothetical protein
LCGLLALAGCADKNLATVAGTVTLDGKPLEGARVQFQPINRKRPSGAVTDADGRYSLQYTFEKSGAEIGRHEVSIAGEDAAGNPRVPAKYNLKSTLEKEVAAGHNEINFDLTTDKRKR